MNDKVKTGLGISGVAAVGYGLGRGIEFVAKKVIQKLTTTKTEKTEEEK